MNISNIKEKTMSRFLKYNFVVAIYDGEEECEEFEYEVTDKEVLDAVSYLIYSDFFVKTQLSDRCDYSFAVRCGIEKFINNFDFLEEVIESYEDEIKEIFEVEARERFNDYRKGAD